MNKLMISEIEELENMTDGEYGFIETQKDNGFKVSDLDSANWCFKKISALKQQVEENNNLADAEIQRINSWREKENKSALDSISYFEYLLKEFYASLRANDKKVKVNTPYGKITVRKANKWHYEEDKVLSWLKENDPLLIKTKEEINKAELKKLYKNGIDTETGEVIEGITIVEEESISISVEGGK